MKLSKRVLTKWRKEALKENAELYAKQPITPKVAALIVQSDRILLMTQELIDQYLLEEK